MDLRVNSYNNFKGYDARPLKGFLMGTNKGSIASEMAKIATKENFKIFLLSETPFHDPYITSLISKEKTRTGHMWAQDLWTIYNNKLFSKFSDNTSKYLLQFFNLKPDFTQQVARLSDKFVESTNNLINIFELCRREDNLDEIRLAGENVSRLNRETHIPGGNLYIIKGENGNEIIAGQNELIKYSEDEISGMFGANKVTLLPQMDYHIDLFIRPLDKKRILLADDNLSVKVMEKAYNDLEKFKDDKSVHRIRKNLKILIDNFSITQRRNINPRAEAVEEKLKDAGYEVIRVPGNIYNLVKTRNDDDDYDYNIEYICNYLNANVLVNNDGDLVYITNKSCVDEDIGIDYEMSKQIGYSFQDAFINTLSPYVKPEHIYFVQGKNDYLPRTMLSKFMGGIHCACAEVPKE